MIQKCFKNASKLLQECIKNANKCFKHASKNASEKASKMFQDSKKKNQKRIQATGPDPGHYPSLFLPPCAERHHRITSADKSEERDKLTECGTQQLHPVHGLRKAPKCGGPQFFLNIIAKNDAPWILFLRAFDSRDMPAGQLAGWLASRCQPAGRLAGQLASRPAGRPAGRLAGHWGPFFLTHGFLNP